MPELNEEYKLVSYGCKRFFDSYSFLSSSLDSLVKSLVDNSHKILKNLEKEILGDDVIIKMINEVETLNKSHRTIVDVNEDFPVEFEKIEQALKNYISERGFEFLKAEFHYNWVCFSEKSANLYEYFSSVGD